MTNPDFTYEKGRSFTGEVDVTAYPEKDGGYTLYLGDQSIKLSQKEADNLGRFLLFDEVKNNQEEK